MTEHAITLTTADGETFAFSCRDDEYLHRGAERSGVLFPVVCRQGACGACRVDLLEGDCDHDSVSPEALTQEQAAQGGMLLCRAKPRSAMALEAPFRAAAVRRETIPDRVVEVAAIELAGAGAIRLVLRYLPDDPLGQAAQFTAGQFVELVVPSGAARAYSLANTANWDGVLEFLIRLRPNGAASSFLRQAKPGDRLIARGPMGEFKLLDGGLAPRWFVAGGTGLAPVLSMLRHMAEFGETQPTRLFFGVNRPAELFGLEAIAAVKAASPQLVEDICVWTAEDGWIGAVGSPADRLAAALAAGGAAEKPEIYVCGPPALIQATRAAAAAAGLPPDVVIAESFSAGA